MFSFLGFSLGRQKPARPGPTSHKRAHISQLHCAHFHNKLNLYELETNEAFGGISSDLAVAAKRIETDFNGSRFDQTFQTGPKFVQPHQDLQKVCPTLSNLQKLLRNHLNKLRLFKLVK